jgi:hypothetical protein
MDDQYVNQMIQKVNKNVKEKILDVLPRNAQLEQISPRKRNFDCDVMN